MAKPAPKKASFLDLLTSPLTLGPAVLGITAGIVLHAFLDWDIEYGYFAAGLGIAIAVLMFITLLVMRGGAGKLPPEVLQAREELMANLETLGRSLQRRAATESTSAGTIAPVEK